VRPPRGSSPGEAEALPVAVGVSAPFPVAVVLPVASGVAVVVPPALDVAVAVPVPPVSAPPLPVAVDAALDVAVDVAVEVTLFGAALEDPPLQAASSRHRAPAGTAARLEGRVGVMGPSLTYRRRSGQRTCRASRRPN
jgi:hypothetical protein